MSSLYTRILVSFWVVMVLVVAGAVGITWLVLAERSDEVARTHADLVQGAAVALGDRGEDGLREWLRTIRSQRGQMRVFVIDPDGRELLGHPLPPWLQRSPPPGTASAPPGPPPPPPPGALMPHQLPQIVDGGGRRYSIAFLPPRHDLGIFDMRETRLAVLLLALMATGVASWFVTRSITRPVSALGVATRALAQGNLDVHLDPRVSSRGDELGTLGRDFDAMAVRLRALILGRERLLRDVSHELRSPLARMRVAVGLARQPGADVGRQIVRLEAEIERLDRLIGQVLHLSRLDARAGVSFDDEIDLVELLDGIARDAAFEAQPREVRIDWQPPAGAHVVRGNAALLASAVENVVRNAIAYTAAGTAVRIALESPAGARCILVDDHGPGVPAAELEKIFEPFHRVAESRERDSGGDGIGLAITARVLAAHGGQASAENLAAGGLRVRLTLPGVAAPASA